MAQCPYPVLQPRYGRNAVTQVRIPRRALRYGKRTRAFKVYRYGGTFSGRRTRSRYGYTQGSYWLVRSDNALKVVHAAKIAHTLDHLRWPLAAFARYIPSASNGPELKPSTRALNTPTFRENALEKHARGRNPLRNVRNRAIRTRKGLKIGRFHVKYRYSGGTTKSPDTGIGWKDHRRLMQSGEWLGRPE